MKADPLFWFLLGCLCCYVVIEVSRWDKPEQYEIEKFYEETGSGEDVPELVSEIERLRRENAKLQEDIMRIYEIARKYQPR